jgi:hypothetical protein
MPFADVITLVISINMAGQYYGKSWKVGKKRAGMETSPYINPSTQTPATSH